MGDVDLDVGKPGYDQQYADWSAGNTPVHPVLGDTTPVNQQQQNQPSYDFAAFANQKAPSLSSANPYTDLGYNSFLRGMGLQQSQIQSQVARQKQGLEAQLNAQRPVFQDKLNEGIEALGNSAANRGVYRSGERLQQQDRYGRDVAREQNSYESGIRGQQADLGAQLQSQLLDLARQQAEQEIAARQRVAQESLSSGSNPLLLQFLQAQLGQG